jgi:hypothetical protein
MARQKSVDDYRLPVLVSAGAHPWNAVPAGGAAVTFMLAGFFLVALSVLAIDLALLFALVQLPGLRRRIGRLADRRARSRAAQRLGLSMQGEWQSLSSVAARTARFNPRRAEVETLLDQFLDVALTHHDARECADATAIDALRPLDGPAGELVEERRRVGERTERAIEALRSRLDETAQKIRLACDLAVAEECETGAELCLGD